MAADPQPVFLDTAYVNALINTRDQWHEAAVRWERKLATDRRQLITTEFVLVEIADGLAAVTEEGPRDVSPVLWEELQAALRNR